MYYALIDERDYTAELFRSANVRLVIASAGVYLVWIVKMKIKRTQCHRLAGTARTNRPWRLYTGS